jgi:hypothetical protein
MFIPRRAPLDLTAERLLGLRLSLNTPVVTTEEVPTAPARAVMIVHLERDGQPTLTVAVRSLCTGSVAFYGLEGDLYGESGLSIGVDAALSFGESLGFLFDEDELEGADEHARERALGLWTDLVGKFATSNAPQPGCTPHQIEDVWGKSPGAMLSDDPGELMLEEEEGSELLLGRDRVEAPDPWMIGDAGAASIGASCRGDGEADFWDPDGVSTDQAFPLLGRTEPPDAGTPLTKFRPETSESASAPICPEGETPASTLDSQPVPMPAGSFPASDSPDLAPAPTFLGLDPAPTASEAAPSAAFVESDSAPPAPKVRPLARVRLVKRALGRGEPDDPGSVLLRLMASF